MQFWTKKLVKTTTFRKDKWPLWNTESPALSLLYDHYLDSWNQSSTPTKRAAKDTYCTSQDEVCLRVHMQILKSWKPFSANTLSLCLSPHAKDTQEELPGCKKMVQWKLEYILNTKGDYSCQMCLLRSWLESIWDPALTDHICKWASCNQHEVTAPTNMYNMCPAANI